MGLVQGHLSPCLDALIPLGQGKGGDLQEAAGPAPFLQLLRQRPGAEHRRPVEGSIEGSIDGGIAAGQGIEGGDGRLGELKVHVDGPVGLEPGR